MKKQLLNFLLARTGSQEIFGGIGKLLIRVFFGLAMSLTHGWATLSGFPEHADKFPDPIGLGNSASMALMLFTEFFCALAVTFGLMTRVAVMPLIFGMSVAFFVFHAADPFAKKELAFLYLAAFSVIFFLGPGRFSLDAILFSRSEDEEN